MGWDINFFARFSEAEPPVRRFARAFELLCAQPGIEGLFAFEMARRPASGPDERVTLGGGLANAIPADVDVVRRHLAARLDEPGWHVQATWIWRETVRLEEGMPFVVGDAMTVAVPQQTHLLGSARGPDLLPPGGEPDLVVDAFDYRRYFPRDGDHHAWWDDLSPAAPACRLARAKIGGLMRRLVPIVELGVVSLWGLRGEGAFSPDTIYAVFHRDPERYRDDNGPALPDVRITNDIVEQAARDMDDVWVPTSGGPIVYDPRLGYGRLGAFYFGLRSRLDSKAEAEDLAALEREREIEATRDKT
jgi:hypothetical protein